MQVQEVPASWPAGAYDLAKTMWQNAAKPAEIAEKCRVSKDQLFKIAKRRGWGARDRVAVLTTPMTESEIAAICRDWHNGTPIGTIEKRYRRGHATIERLAVKHDWERRDLTRDPLPAGHSLTWGLINEGTSLAGAAFPR